MDLGNGAASVRLFKMYLGQISDILESASGSAFLGIWANCVYSGS